MDGDGLLRVAATAGRARGAVQGPEHVKQRPRHARWRRDRPGAGRAGRGGGCDSLLRDEPDPAQAERKPGFAACAQGQGRGTLPAGRLLPPFRRTLGRRSGLSRRLERALRCARDGRRGLTRGAQSHGPGPREPAPDPPYGRTLDPGRRHRPWRRVRAALRYLESPAAGGSCTLARCDRQQVPGRSLSLSRPQRLARPACAGLSHPRHGSLLHGAASG